MRGSHLKHWVEEFALSNRASDSYTESACVKPKSACLLRAACTLREGARPQQRPWQGLSAFKDSKSLMDVLTAHWHGGISPGVTGGYMQLSSEATVQKHKVRQPKCYSEKCENKLGVHYESVVRQIRRAQVIKVKWGQCSLLLTY